MATDAAKADQYEVVEQPYAETDNSVETRKAASDKLLGIHKITSNRFWQFAVLTGIMFVFGIVGLAMRLNSGFDDKGAWGYYAAIFSFLMTTTAAAHMVAIAPRIANAHWRRPISRAAEIWTLAGCLNLILYIPLIDQTISPQTKGPLSIRHTMGTRCSKKQTFGRAPNTYTKKTTKQHDYYMH